MNKKRFNLLIVIFLVSLVCISCFLDDSSVEDGVISVEMKDGKTGHQLFPYQTIQEIKYTGEHANEVKIFYNITKVDGTQQEEEYNIYFPLGLEEHVLYIDIVGRYNGYQTKPYRVYNIANSKWGNVVSTEQELLQAIANKLLADGQIEEVGGKYKLKGTTKKLQGDFNYLALHDSLTDLSYLFYGMTSPLSKFSEIAKDFNGDISCWDVSNVTNMSFMFRGEDGYENVFNQDLNDWNVSNVTNMSWMFAYTKDFNKPLNNWDISKVDSMHHMFFNAKSFDQDLNDWNDRLKDPLPSHNNIFSSNFDNNKKPEKLR